MKPSIRYQPALDGLRALAVLAVVCYHAGLPVPAGYVGVDIFFVISGYLITRLLHEELQRDARIDLAAFYARRARRILPALSVVLLTTLGLASLLLGNASEVAKSAAAASIFVANIFFQAHTSGYWSGDAQTMPLLHLWSLSVEEQFYLAWPFVLLLARRTPVMALVLLAIASFALCEYWQWSDPSAAFYEMPARGWELALGGVIGLRRPTLPKGSAWVGLLAVLVACFVPVPHFPGAGALPAVLGSALLVAAIQNGESPALLTSRPMVSIGLVSYGFYLWHWPLLALNRATWVGVPPITLRLGLVVAALVLAVATYVYVEKPIRSVAARLDTRRVLAYSAGACLMLALASLPLLETRALPPATDPMFTPPKTRPTIAIWGDSHAAAWMPFAQALATRQHRGLVDLTFDGCAPTVGYAMTFEDALHPTHSAKCLAWNAAVAKKIAKGGFDTVIISARWLPLFQQLPPEYEPPYPTDAASVTALRAAFARSFDAISPYVRRIIVMGPLPQLRERSARCIDSGNPSACAMTRAAFDGYARGARMFIGEMAASHPNVYVVDPADFMCTRSTCPVSRWGIVLYRDDSHVSKAAARRFAESVVWNRDGAAASQFAGASQR